MRHLGVIEVNLLSTPFFYSRYLGVIKVNLLSTQLHNKYVPTDIPTVLRCGLEDSTDRKSKFTFFS